MRRYDAIKMIVANLTDEIVISNIGHPSQELFEIKDRPRNFYMLGSMGLASSIGLGIALSQSERVVVIDGEGSVLMNLGGLATLGINQPENLCLFIIDNEAYGSTGFQPTFTSRGIDIAEIARSCKIDKTLSCRDEAGLKKALDETLGKTRGPFCVIIKTSKEMPGNLSIIPHSPVFIRDRLMESLTSKKEKQ
jgi:sulfopyruvate decarboxylase subunit beta